MNNKLNSISSGIQKAKKQDRTRKIFIDRNFRPLILPSDKIILRKVQIYDEKTDLIFSEPDSEIQNLVRGFLKAICVS
ncbi:hypothetical protein AYI70_g1948 [Smittium culicis]|uniref:Uncharacterized protein n=1 Tax=Smittium culicis TaxID=133412 RepID=A0A1R1YAM3_9FUNG|nr:hypothetical protein AYI70_g1948 [Smittium culicis]